MLSVKKQEMADKEKTVDELAREKKPTKADVEIQAEADMNRKFIAECDLQILNIKKSLDILKKEIAKSPRPSSQTFTLRQVHRAFLNMFGSSYGGDNLNAFTESLMKQKAKR